MRRIAAILVALLGLSTFVAVATPAAAATTDLVINEVESDGDATDWVELNNPTGAAIDASGLRMTDDNPLAPSRSRAVLSFPRSASSPLT